MAGSIAGCGGSPSPAPVSVANTTEPAVEAPAPSTSTEPKSDGTHASVEAAVPASATSATSATSANAATSVSSASEPARESGPLPTTCTVQGSRKACVPDAEFAKRLCGSEYPDVALSLFSQGTPFTRAYMTRDVDGWNAGGGRTRRSKLLFDEEVLVVAHRKANPNGIVMVAANGDTGSYDVLRWDGSCASVMAEEITMSKAPKPKRSTIPWRHLEESTKSALLAAPKIKSGYDAWNKACDGSDAAKCTKAEAALNAAIVDHVRASKSLPSPSHRP
ncbi:hypothetical protein [Pendulispora albinea]|uniref:Lipoprotein n=1 Tax=Pendulispora albinea TaxID=2741071 RepID=A0ABZ2M031_9BACT